jgi:tripartite-type tricarboxylate transporter receptor subunit TctC
MNRRVIAARLALAALAFACAAQASAQTYPSKPLRLIVPYAPGGVLDALLRPISLLLGQSLGQPVLVENRPGGNTAVGTGVCAKGAPDGYTVCASGNGVTLNPLLYRSMSYDPEHDLAPVTNMVFVDGVIVANAAMPFNNLRELVAYAKANPGKLNFGSFGEGSTAHLYLEWIKKRAGIDMAHIVYKGAAPVITATLTNEVQLNFMNTGAVLQHIKAGKLKAIVMPAPKRSKFLPDVPTLAEEGYDFRPTSWFGLFAAAGTPRPILGRIQGEVRTILLSDKFREQILTPQFYEAVANTPEEFAEFLKSERALAVQLVKTVGLKPFD